MAAPDNSKAGSISAGDLLHMRQNLAQGAIKGVAKSVEEIAAGVAAAEMAAGDQSIENAPHPLDALERGAEKLLDSFIHPAGDMNLSNAQHPADKLKQKAADKMAAMSAAGLAASTVEAGTILGEQAVLFVPGGEEIKAVGVAKELGALEAAAVDAGKAGRALHADAPKVTFAEQAYRIFKGETAIDTTADLLSGIDFARVTVMKRDNVFKEAVDRTDSTLTHSGQTVAQIKHYNDWNRVQVAKRAEFYKFLIAENPELAETLLGQDVTNYGLMQLLNADVNDHFIGINPYNSLLDKDEMFKRTGIGHSDDKMQAALWGIEWKEGSKNLLGMMAEDLKGGEIGLNRAFYDALRSIKAGDELNLQMHRELGAMLVDPTRPMNPELAQKAQLLLSARLENGTLSAEARSALPPELQALPAVKLESLQEKIAQVVPENLRLAAGYEAPALAHVSTANAANSASAEAGKALSVSQPANLQQLQDMRREMLSPLSMVIGKKPLEASLPPTEAMLAAQANVDALAKHHNPILRAAISVANGVSGHAGMGYALGKTDVARVGVAAAQSDWEGFLAAAKVTGRQVATTAVVAGTAAVSLPATAVVVGGLVVKSVAKDYELLDKASAFLAPTIERAHYKAHALGNALKEQGQTAYDQFAAMIPRDATGSLTPQGQVIMQQIEQNAARQAESALPLIPPAEIQGP